MAAIEGVQDQVGKHGGQAGMPKSPPRPTPTEHHEDVSEGVKSRTRQK
jgi:hypothetical protein